MLSSIRNSRKILQIVLWLVILAFVSTIFVVWGIGSRENQGAYVVKIGDTVVGYEEYRTFVLESRKTKDERYKQYDDIKDKTREDLQE